MADLNDNKDPSHRESADFIVGSRLRELRARQQLSLRALAARSGLNINTLSLIENGKTSPSVSTLQQLALALNVPLAAFFEKDPRENKVVFTPLNQRSRMDLRTIQFENLAKDLAGRVVQPFVVTQNPGTDSGPSMIVHTGHEFVYCLDGSIRYKIEQEEYILTPGDCLVFEAHLPHCWQNTANEIAKFLLILYPADEREEPAGRHFNSVIQKGDN